MTIYSVRNSAGQEVWWTTSRRKAQAWINAMSTFPPRNKCPWRIYVAKPDKETP